MRSLRSMRGNTAGIWPAFCSVLRRRYTPTGMSARPRKKERGKKKEEDDAEIGIVTEMARELGQPVADHGDAGGGGDGAAGQADRVVAEKQRGAKPFFAEFFNADTLVQPPCVGGPARGWRARLQSIAPILGERNCSATLFLDLSPRGIFPRGRATWGRLRLRFETISGT